MVNDAERHEAWDRIEPEAHSPIAGNFRSRPGEHEIELSKAISLKRIADALWGNPSFYGINDLVEAVRERKP